MASNEKDVNRCEAHQQDREQDNVAREESAERSSADLPAPAQDSLQRFADQRCGSGDPRSDNRCPVSPLIPRQEIARERGGQDHKEQEDTEQPGSLSGALVRAPEDHAKHVQHREQHHRAGAPVVDAPHDSAKRHLSVKKPDTLIRVVRSGRVVECQYKSRGDLDHCQEQQHAPQAERPAEALRHRLEEEIREHGRQPGSRLQPVGQTVSHEDPRRYNLPFSTRVAIRASGLLGGPPTFFPVSSNIPPWHGHTKHLETSRHRTGHPR